MGIWVLIVGILPVIYGLHPGELLRQGAIVSPQGSVLVVKDVMTASAPLTSLAAMPRNLNKLKVEARQLFLTLHEERSKTWAMPVGIGWSTMFLDRLEWQVKFIQSTIDSILLDLPIDPYQRNLIVPRMRNKRGLFDIGGKIIGNVFGLATEEDLDEINAKFHKITNHIRQQDKFINLDHQLIGKLEASVAKTQSTLNTLVTAFQSAEMREISFVSFVLAHMQYQAIIAHLNEVHKQVNSFSQSLVEAGQGHVTTTLLPLHDLRQIIKRAVQVHDLKPIFTNENLLQYYKFLEVTITKTSVLVHVPFSDGDYYDYFKLSPFPSHTNVSLSVLCALPQDR